MTRTYGEFEVTLDSKGRIMIPAGYKKQISEQEAGSFMLCKGSGPFLMLFTLSQWKKVEERLDTLNDYNEEALELKLSLMSGASPVEMDAAGRIVISRRMLAHAHLNKDIIMLGISDKVLIWDAAEYDRSMNADPQRVKMLSGKILGASSLNPIKGGE